MRPLREHVVCADGWAVSIQASRTHYCEPRIDDAESYLSVELGFPSAHEPMLDDWCEDLSDPTGTVYGYVPAAVVRSVLAAHGGIASGERPPLAVGGVGGGR